jgi:hypothetical protein
MDRSLAGLVMVVAIVMFTSIALTLLSIIIAWANEFRKGK